MTRLALLALTLCLVGASAGGWLALRDEASAQAPAEARIGRSLTLPERLRYIGRDPWTGLPAPVNDRFIADVEYAISRYGKDEREPVPPPPPGDTDVARLAIPAIGVDAPVLRYGLDNYHRLEVPQDTTNVGWNPGYTALPGTGGATFFAAHVQYGGAPGVFNRLKTLASGDEVAVLLSSGELLRYRVTSVVDYHLSVIDMGALLAGREGTESITLMTCSGQPVEGEFEYRTVVLAERVYE